MAIEITIDDKSPEVLNALINAVERGLEAIGETAVDYAQSECPRDTGNLQGSITCQRQEFTELIGTNVEYGKYVEFGTGKFAESGGRRTAWRYQDDAGNWHVTEGQKPHPFLRPAIEKHLSEYKNLMIESIKNA